MSNAGETIPALIAEYNAIRAASLAREHNRNVLMQFELVVLSAVLAGLPTMLDRGFWLILPGVSILLMSLVSASIDQSALLWELALYECGVLRPRLISLLGYSDTPAGMVGIWDWQNFHMRTRRRSPRSTIRRAMEKISNGGRLSIDAVISATAAALLILFYDRHFAVAALFEKATFMVAGVLFVWSFLGSLSHFRTRRKQRLQFLSEASGRHIIDKTSLRDWSHLEY